MDINEVIRIVLAIIMLGIGMSLKWEDFKQIVDAPKSFFYGLIFQMLILPIMAFFLCLYLDLSPEWKVGFLILSICPGGTTASFLSYLFRANTALSIVLTNINSLLTLFTIPLLSNFFLSYFLGQNTEIHLPFWSTFLEIMSITLLPALLGLGIRKLFPALAKKVQNPMKLLTVLMLGIVFIVKIFFGKEKGGSGLSLQDTYALLPLSILLNLLGLLLGYYLPKWIKLSKEDAYTIGVEAAIHNTSLAFLITGTLLHNEEMIKPALVYSLFSFWTAVVFGYLTMGKPSLKN